MSLTTAQLEARKNRLTGSTIAALLGYNPYTSPEDAWAVQTQSPGVGLDFTGLNPDVIAGNRLEDAIAKWVAEDLGITDLSEPGTLLLGEMFAATPDRISVKDNIGIQVKNHRPQMARTYKGKPGDAGKWDNNLVPLHIQIQCQWEMLICNETGVLKDCDRWILATFFGGGDRRPYWIKRDAGLQDSLMMAGAAFWIDHLDPNGPLKPPTDWTWHARGKGYPIKKGTKLSAHALEVAPIPFAEPFEPAIPFSSKP